MIVAPLIRFSAIPIIANTPATISKVKTVKNEKGTLFYKKD